MQLSFSSLEDVAVSQCFRKLLLGSTSSFTFTIYYDFVQRLFVVARKDDLGSGRSQCSSENNSNFKATIWFNYLFKGSALKRASFEFFSGDIIDNWLHERMWTIIKIINFFFCMSCTCNGNIYNSNSKLVICHITVILKTAYFFWNANHKQIINNNLTTNTYLNNNH